MSEEEFDDIAGTLSGFGSLAGPGAEAHHTAHTRRTKDGSGVTHTVPCDNCGQVHEIQVTWDEMIYGAARQVPPGWKYEPQYGAIHPNAGCRSCRHVLMILVTPDECKRHLRAGEQAGSISPQYLQVAFQKLQQAGAGYRG